MDLQRRALYNLLRMNWLQEPQIEVEPWQVEDYRELPKEELFRRLRELGVRMDEAYFLAFSEEFDNPEELSDAMGSEEAEPQEQDECYLLVFELWRRLIPERPSLSIFCDELDRQIYAHDRAELEDEEHMQDVLANLQDLLDENTDQGESPNLVFNSVADASANDLESFLYDFITGQIESGNLEYASELLDGFYPYVSDPRWFALLKARLVADSDADRANEIIEEIFRNTKKLPDLEFDLEMLIVLTQVGERAVFVSILRRAIELLNKEEDLQDLISICADYFQCLDRDEDDLALQKLLKKRSGYDLNQPIDKNDSAMSELIGLVGSCASSSAENGD